VNVGDLRGPSFWLATPLVYLVTDGRRPIADLLERIEAAVSGGVRIVQLREKQRPAGELARLAQEAQKRIGGQAALMINDRVDVALAAKAQGVHLPAAGLDARVVRSLAPGLIVGRSVHAAREAAHVSQADVDYLLLGTIFPSRTHPGGTVGGIGLVRATRPFVRVPLVAIGGITAGNAAEVIEAGADGVAVVSAILEAADPGAAARELLGAVERGVRARSIQGSLAGAAACD
jgi:thiamine-phosphate pyrophosphorylase